MNSPMNRSLSSVQQSSTSSHVESSAPHNTSSAGLTTPTGAIKLIKRNHNQPAVPHQNSRLQKQISAEHRFSGQNLFEDHPNGTDQSRVTLDSIITEYLTNQHALCKNPMATCPQFNLFVPHKCPDPKPKMQTANNFVVRCARRAFGYQSKTMDRRFIHSRFCPIQTIRSSTDEGFFTCAKFMPGNRSVIVGDYNGNIHLYNMHSGNEESTFTAHDNYIIHVEPNRTGEFALTCSAWGRNVSAMWGLKNFEMKYSFHDDEYVEYSKVTQDRVIGTKMEVARIYDANTGQSICRLVPTISNQYTKNKATFSMNDELVLCDGVLFDVNSGKPIHKLDKLNQTQSGVFHPNGLEIVSNTEVWDIRTFHLLKTVPVLNQCSVVFSPVNNVLYAFAMEQDMDDGDSKYESSFKTVDSTDYSSIATIDVKKGIYDLSVNIYGTQIAVVENQGMYNSVQESVVRLYDVGRRRDDEDEQDEEDDEDDMDNSEDDGSDNDDTAVIDLSEQNEGDNDDDREDDNDSESSDSSWTISSASMRSWDDDEDDSMFLAL